MLKLHAWETTDSLKEGLTKVGIVLFSHEEPFTHDKDVSCTGVGTPLSQPQLNFAKASHKGNLHKEGQTVKCFCFVGDSPEFVNTEV